MVSASSANHDAVRVLAMHSLAEVSELRGVSVRFLRRMVSERRVPFYKIGKRVFLHLNEFDDFVVAHRVPPIAP